MKLYQYPNCSTCKKALKYLNQSDVAFKNINIVESPPSKTELKKMLSAYNGNLKKLFNTSGQLYREMNIKEKINSFSTDEAIDLLAANGKLIKRPFLIGSGIALVGFKEDQWQEQVAQ